MTLRERRAVLPGRIGQLMPAQRREVQAHVAEHAEGAVEAHSRVPFSEQVDDEGPTLVPEAAA